MEDLSFLVQETFAQVKKSHFFPTEAGLLYNLQVSPSIFVIRALATSHLSYTRDDILENPENFPSLRLVNEDMENLHFFPTKNIEQAEWLQKIVNNKRYPRYEETMCNMSDPGFSWWAVKNDQGVTLTKKLISLDLSQASKLGEFGDNELMFFMFQKLSQLLKAMPGEWSSYQLDHRFVIKGPPNHFFIQLWHQFLINGDFSQDFDHALDFLAHKVSMNQDELYPLKDFLNDLGFIRKFWIKIFNQLDNGLIV